MAGGLPSVSSRFHRTFYRSARALFIPHYTGWSNAAGSAPSGAPLTITAGQSFIRLPVPEKTNWKKNWVNGNGSPLPLHWYCNKVKGSIHELSENTRSFHAFWKPGK